MFSVDVVCRNHNRSDLGGIEHFNNKVRIIPFALYILLVHKLGKKSVL